MDPTTEATQRVGATLRNKWRLERLLGVGGMAAVYVGVHSIGRRAAIKILHPEIARSKEVRARFQREAEAVNRLGHPGVVEILDIDTTERDEPFLVMELLDGESLAQRAERRGGLEIAELLRVSDELCDVLAAAHAQGIIHRDIKLDNLFLTADGRLKVLDFGIAQMRTGSGDVRTRAGATLGTPQYMAPEQIMGQPIDARADLFAVGATMFRVVAGRHVHEATNEAEMLVKMATSPAPPLATVAPGAPPGVCAVVDRALQFDREARYPDAATMQRDVRALRAGVEPPYATARALEKPAPPGSGERTLAAAPAAVPGLAFQEAVAAQTAWQGAATPASAFEPTVVATPASMPALAAGSAPAQAKRDRDEKNVLAAILATALGVIFLLVAVVVILLRARGSAGPGTVADAPGSSVDPPASAAPGDDVAPWPTSHAKPGKPRKWKGHGRGKHKGHDEDD